MTTDTQTQPPTDYEVVRDSVKEQSTRAHQQGPTDVVMVLIARHPGKDAVTLRDQHGLPKMMMRYIAEAEKHGFIEYKGARGQEGWFLTSKGDIAIAEAWTVPPIPEEQF